MRYAICLIGAFLAAGCGAMPTGGPGSGNVTAGCARDTDCKGDRVCIDGACVGPAPWTDAGAPIDADAAAGVAADLEPIADLRAARDLVAVFDIAHGPDLVTLDLAAPPDLASPPDLAQCGKFGWTCCGQNTCEQGLRCLVDGDQCNAQTPRRCTVPMNCGGANLPPCADNGQPSQFGRCIAGLQPHSKPGVGFVCTACYP